jgi:DNA-binding NarL/FixJ family response regulator
LEPVRILIVDDFPVMVKGLAALIDDEADLEVVGQAATVAEAVSKAQEVQPDVAVLDYRLPDGTGIDAAIAIRHCSPHTAILFLSRHEEDAIRLAAFEAGAAGYLSKAQAADDVVDAIRHAARHETLIGSRNLADLLALRSRATRCMDSLTPRELEILTLMAKGAENKRIARELGITYATVRGHVRNIVAKQDAHSRLEAVANAAQLGLVERAFVEPPQTGDGGAHGPRVAPSITPGSARGEPSLRRH